MLEVSHTDYGVRLDCAGDLGVEQMAADVDRAIDTIRTEPEGFSILADMRELTLVEEEAAEELKRLMAAAEANGFDRVAAVVSKDMLKLQLKRLSRESRGDDDVRFFDAREHDDWEGAALAFVRGET